MDRGSRYSEGWIYCSLQGVDQGRLPSHKWLALYKEWIFPTKVTGDITVQCNNL